MGQAAILPSAPLETIDRGQEHLQNRVLKVAEENCGKILIVEDEIELAEVLEFNLIRQGFDVLVAHDGLEACRLIGQEKPDLILLDLMLPLLDGWEICRMVRSQSERLISKTPIIMLSALGSSEDRIKGYDLGADLYLPKPYAIKEVIIKSRDLIKKRREFLQLSEQMNSLQNMNQLQDKWQQALFHELRNQLTVISGMAEYIHSSTSQLPQERSVEFAGQIANSSYFLGEIAENYLLIQQLEKDPGHMHSEAVIVNELLTEIAQLLEPLAVRKACDLEIDCPVEISLNLPPIVLKLIVSSLLDNALKYSQVDGHVSLSVAIDEGQVVIQLQDDGPGIPEEERDKVFDRFYRGAAVRHSNTGTGLGLFMARTLALTIGGSLQLVENNRPGCCLALHLPRGLK